MFFALSDVIVVMLTLNFQILAIILVSNVIITDMTEMTVKTTIKSELEQTRIIL